MISMPELRRPVHGAPAAEEAGVRLAAALGASDIASLRRRGAAELNAAAAAAQFAPFGVVDGHVLPEQMVDAFAAGRQAHVPLLAGFNAGEIRSLRVLAPAQPPASAGEYEAQIRARYGDLADDFLRLYPSSNMMESILATTRDALYGWTAENAVRRQTALGIPSYLYLFDHSYPAADEAGLHAFHASELPYVFGTFEGTPPYWPKPPRTAGERALSDAMIGYWTSFARSGSPRAADAPDWAPFGQAHAYMHFTDVPHLLANLMPGMYALNEAVVCRRDAHGGIGWNWNVGLWSPPNPPALDACRTAP
jgi:para-nitrobenzyl esterase